jgi:hypothetical protein
MYLQRYIATFDSNKNAIYLKVLSNKRTPREYHYECRLSRCLKNMADKSVGIVITDPPYGLNIMAGGSWQEAKSEPDELFDKGLG